jgi:hypothetical protein
MVRRSPYKHAGEVLVWAPAVLSYSLPHGPQQVIQPSNNPGNGSTRCSTHNHAAAQQPSALQTNGTLYLTNTGRLSAVWGFI